MRSRSRSSHIPGALFKYLYHSRGGNDIRELRKFSTQLDHDLKAKFISVQMVGQYAVADLGQRHFQV